MQIWLNFDENRTALQNSFRGTRSREGNRARASTDRAVHVKNELRMSKSSSLVLGKEKEFQRKRKDVRTERKYFICWRYRRSLLVANLTKSECEAIDAIPATIPDAITIDVIPQHRRQRRHVRMSPSVIELGREISACKRISVMHHVRIHSSEFRSPTSNASVPGPSLRRR